MNSTARGAFCILWGLGAILVAFSSKEAYGAENGLERNSVASWYSTEACKYNSDPACPTASGEGLYELEARGVRFAAMWDVPFGSRWQVTNSETGATTEVVVLDRGPARRLGRAIDLGKDAFRDIADPAKGLVAVRLVRIS